METISQEQLAQLKTKVAQAAISPSFVHYEWYTKYHLEIFEKIANELCDRHKEADRAIVNALVWLHDYGKMLDVEKQYELSLSEGTLLLREIGVTEELIEKVMQYLVLFEKKMEIDLHSAPVEVQIASSSDAASHMIGPFFSVFWKENSGRTSSDLMQSNLNKLKKDWERKITLPEVHELMRARHAFIMEQNGIIPEQFFD